MRFLAVAAMAAVLAAAANASSMSELWRWSKHGWHSYASPDGVFSVSYMHRPSHHPKPCDWRGKDSVPGEYYLSMNNMTAQEVVVCDFSQRPEIADPAAEHVVLLTESGIVMLADEPDKIGDHTGRKIRYRGKNGSNGTQRIFLVGRKLYVVYGYLPQGAVQQQKDEVGHFLESFRFTDSAPPLQEDGD